MNQAEFCRHMTLADEPKVRDLLKDIFPMTVGSVSEIKALRYAMQGCKTVSSFSIIFTSHTLK